MLNMFGLRRWARTAANTAHGEVCLLKVSGMHCGACAARVENAAKSIDGVIAARVSLRNETAKITYHAAKTTPTTIAEGIAEKTAFATEVQAS